MTPSHDTLEPNTAPQDLTIEEEQELTQGLWELRRIAAQTKELNRVRTEVLYPRLLPLLERAGSRTVIDPVTGEPLVAGIRAPQTLQVDYDNLVDLVGPDIAASVCKPPVVDTTDEGRFMKAIEDGRIPLEIVADVASYKASAAYVGFAKPDGPKTPRP
jgi:hypothetical protein